uniref:Uncharacterized protein n=1 Tax=Catharus ustulatus TaxID=91951 RepID=A0A8C3Y5K0_CATUS
MGALLWEAGRRGPQDPLPTKIPVGVTHLRERSAKMGAKDWHSLDQLAKNSTIHVTRLSLSSSSCHRGMGLGSGGQSPPKPPELGRYSHRWSLPGGALSCVGEHCRATPGATGHLLPQPGQGAVSAGREPGTGPGCGNRPGI